MNVCLVFFTQASLSKESISTSWIFKLRCRARSNVLLIIHRLLVRRSLSCASRSLFNLRKYILRRIVFIKIIIEIGKQDWRLSLKKLRRLLLLLLILCVIFPSLWRIISSLLWISSVTFPRSWCRLWSWCWLWSWSWLRSWIFLLWIVVLIL